MTTKLGKYTIPKDTDERKYVGEDGSNGEGSYGSASGLQQKFADVVSEFVSAAQDAGLTIETGEHGWISRSDAQSLSDGGNSMYLGAIKTFGWGLAVEVSSLSGETSDGKSASNWVSEKQSDYGLVCTTVQSSGGDSVLAGRYITPSSVIEDEGATEIKYEDASSDSNSSSSGSSVSSVAYFFSNAFSSMQNVAEAEMLRGQRALANDEPVFNSIKTACNASMRSFMSLADGRFCAFYPDYYGLYEGCNATPFLELENIDLVNLTVTQSDKNFYSHVFVPSTDYSGKTLSYIYSMGVVSIESDTAARVSEVAANSDSITSEVSDSVSAILSKLINIPEGEEWRYTPKELYRRYGARPAKGYSLGSLGSIVDSMSSESEDSSTKPQYILPFLAALYEFMYQWGQQNEVRLEITFQPSLFPGCRIKLKGFDVSFFVQSVSHSMSYESGFTTTASCICPVGTLVSGMVNINRSEAAE